MARRGRGPFHGSARHTPLPHSPVEPAAALTAIGAAIYGWDIGSGSLAWGPNAAEALGIPDIGIFTVAKAFEEAVESQGGASRADAIAASEASDEGDGVPYRAHYALRTRADRLIMVEDTGRWFADADGRPARARGTILTDLCPSGQNGLAAGLRDRAALLAQIVDDVAEAQRSRHALTLVVGLVDGAVPDSEAAPTGLSRCLKPLMRRRDRFVPYAPGRFALALASCPAGEAASALERLLGLAGREGLEPYLRLGAASAPDHAADAPALLRRAEEALASAAPGHFALYRAPAPAPAADPPGTPPDVVIGALNGRQLVAAHRPVLDSRTRDPVLVTLDPRLGRDGPAACAGDIAAAAERAGLSLLVDTRLLEAAADHLASHLVARVALPIAPSTLHDGEWLNALAAHLGARPGIESRLVVEVPESTLADPATRGRLTAMKALGVGIMVSGFGGGRAAMKQLRHLPVDLLKIDGALVGNLPRSTDDRLLVHRLVDLAHHLGLGTVAEWVDDEPKARLLADWGVDYIEGPLCGRAIVPAHEIASRRALAG
ncbi:MAG TPA: EAL domain-containing protein [Microvirga sp.]|jgi:EAL domain-containing protein (putative c-di-GMP-specific phosphodiesterase class I)|nr:EAL domain-containing protein [Microvirga sp.]